SPSRSSGGPNTANRCTSPRTAATSVLLSLFLDINAPVRLDNNESPPRTTLYIDYIRRQRHDLVTRVSHPKGRGRASGLAKVRIGWEPTLDLGRNAPALEATRLTGELAFLAPLPTNAGSVPSRLRHHRQHRLH